MEKPLIGNTSTAAKAVGVDSFWLFDEAKAGRVPCLALPKRQFIFNIAALEQHLAERATQLPQPIPARGRKDAPATATEGVSHAA